MPPNQNNPRLPQVANLRNLLGEPSNRRAANEEVPINRPQNNLRVMNLDEPPNQPIANHDDDVQNRLQRNLHLRSRRHENDMFNMPKRFSESAAPSHDRMNAMAAFNDTNADSPSTSKASPREKRLQSLRRMEEKISKKTIRQVNAAPEPIDDQPAPQKRIKRNCIGLFVCDISNILLAENPFIEWVEHKNFGHIENAPERLILSSLVAGNGELIMFGGLRKESLSKSSDATMQVSNGMHFLQVPRDVIWVENINRVVDNWKLYCFFFLFKSFPFLVSFFSFIQNVNLHNISKSIIIEIKKNTRRERENSSYQLCILSNSCKSSLQISLSP